MWRKMLVGIMIMGISVAYAANASQIKIADDTNKGEAWYAPGVKNGPHILQTTLLSEDFEGGVMPAGWTTSDGNGDGYTWGVIASSAWHPDAMPPNPGDYIAAYDDDAIGSNPATDEELIAPAVYTGNVGDSAVVLIYGFGYQNLAGYDTFAVKVRTHDGSSWGSWQIVSLYDYDVGSDAWDSLDLSGYLPADSLQVMFSWWDHRSSHWDWYVAIDNVLIGVVPPPPPPPQFYLIYDFDFNEADQGFTHLYPANDPKACPPDSAVDDWQWGTPSVVGPTPGDPTCDDVPLTNCWGTNLSGNYSGTGGTKSSSRLVSPSITLPDTCAAGVWLEICHWYDIETNFDGGNAVVFDPPDPYDGAPTAILPVVSGKAYDGIISTSSYFFACLVDSEIGFTGHQAQWYKSYFDLTPYQGQTVRFGFDFGSDNSVTYPGWYIKWARVWCLQPPTGVGEKAQRSAVSFALLEAKPNPTKGVTEISFAIPKTTDVELSIYDVSGRVISTLIKGKLTAGTHTVKWNGLDSQGKKVSQGVYFYKLTTGEFSATKKLILIR